MAQNIAITEKKCSGDINFCKDDITVAGTGAAKVAKYAGNAVCSSIPSKDSNKLVAGTTPDDCAAPPPPPKTSFNCKSIGIVPDPDNCQKYD